MGCCSVTNNSNSKCTLERTTNVTKVVVVAIGALSLLAGIFAVTVSYGVDLGIINSFGTSLGKVSGFFLLGEGVLLFAVTIIMSCQTTKKADVKGGAVAELDESGVIVPEQWTGPLYPLSLRTPLARSQRTEKTKLMEDSLRRRLFEANRSAWPTPNPKWGKSVTFVDQYKAESSATHTPSSDLLLKLRKKGEEYSQKWPEKTPIFCIYSAEHSIAALYLKDLLRMTFPEAAFPWIYYLNDHGPMQKLLGQIEDPETLENYDFVTIEDRHVPDWTEGEKTILINLDNPVTFKEQFWDDYGDKEKFNQVDLNFPSPEGSATAPNEVDRFISMLEKLFEAAGDKPFGEIVEAEHDD